MSFLKSMALPPFGFQRILRQTITRMMIPIAIARTELMTRTLSHFEFRGKFLRQSCYFTMMLEWKIRAPRQRATAHGAEKLDRLNSSISARNNFDGLRARHDHGAPAVPFYSSPTSHHTTRKTQTLTTTASDTGTAHRSSRLPKLTFWYESRRLRWNSFC